MTSVLFPVWRKLETTIGGQAFLLLAESPVMQVVPARVLLTRILLGRPAPATSYRSSAREKGAAWGRVKAAL